MRKYQRLLLDARKEIDFGVTLNPVEKDLYKVDEVRENKTQQLMSSERRTAGYTNLQETPISSKLAVNFRDV